jgi:hypothetical protein
MQREPVARRYLLGRAAFASKSVFAEDGESSVPQRPLAGEMIE